MYGDEEWEWFQRESAQDERAEREERQLIEQEDDIRSGKRLSLDVFKNPVFDSQRPVKRRVNNRERQEWAYEGVTTTDNFVKVGWSYYLSDGVLSIKNEQNQQLFLEEITKPGDFETAMKKADKKQSQLDKKEMKKRTARE